MNNIFDLEHQYNLFLERMNMKEADMPAIQKKVMRETFAGAFGQMMVILRDGAEKYSEEDFFSGIDSLETQVSDFFLSENQSFIKR